MFFFARRTAGALVRLLVVVLSIGTSIPFAVHGDAGHDPCDTVDASAAPRTIEQAPAASPAPRHCDVCHWLRSLRAFDVALERPVAVNRVGLPSVTLAVSPVVQLSLPSAPSRAPPA
jgi:hypothetical protein